MWYNYIYLFFPMSFSPLLPPRKSDDFTAYRQISKQMNHIDETTSPEDTPEIDIFAEPNTPQTPLEIV